MISKIRNFLFKNLTPRQTITKNIFWLSVSQIGSRFIKAIIIIYAARVLGAAEYGIFAYVVGFAGFFTVFADIGVSTLLTREIAAQTDKRKEYFATSFWIKLFLLFATGLLTIFLAPHFSKIKEAIYLFPLVALMTAFDGLGEFFSSFLRGLEKMEWEAFVIIAENIVIVAAGFVFLAVSPTAKSLILSYIASLGFGALMAALFMRRQFFGIFYFDKNLAYRIISLAWPIAFSALGIFMINTDVVMLGWWRTSAEIGYYSVGQRIIPFLYTLPALLCTGVFPALSRLVQQNERQKEKNLNEKTMTTIFLIALPLIVGGVILANPIIKFIFGQAYLPGVPAFRILISAIIWIFPSVFLSYLVLAHNQQKKIMKYVAISSLGNIIINFFLIPLWGIVGAAIATFSTQAIYVIPIWRLIKKTAEFETIRHLKKIIAAAIIMGGLSFALNYFKINIILNIVLSGGLYFGLLYLLKEKIFGEIPTLFGNHK